MTDHKFQIEANCLEFFCQFYMYVNVLYINEICMKLRYNICALNTDSIAILCCTCKATRYFIHI